MESYRCQHCGAEDSIRCALLEPIERYPDMKYPKSKLAVARAAGCRVVHYLDLRRKEERG